MMAKYNKEKIKAWQSENKEKVRLYKLKNKKETKDKARFLIKSLKEHHCCPCGESRWYCLDFRHKDPSKKKNTVCNLIRSSYSINAIKKEIEKCEIICSNCHRLKHIKGVKTNGEKCKFVDAIKSKSCCVDCGINKQQCLDFHHIDEKTKVQGIGFMIRDKKYSLEELKNEINKCVVVCSNCHKHRHNEGK